MACMDFSRSACSAVSTRYTSASNAPHPISTDMQARLISLIARTLSLLPLSFNQTIGAAIGWLAWVTNSRARLVTEFNLQHCFPNMQDTERQALGLASLQHTGKQLTECAWIWHRQPRNTLTLVGEVRGEQLLQDALDSERGIIIVSPHIGNWELCSLVLSQQTPFTYFYRSPRNKSLEPLMLKWRLHVGGSPATLDSGGIRKGLRLINQGGVVGILPDQEPDRDNGVFAPFFDQPALTMTLLPRLAARSRAHVIMMVVERLPKARGWRIHYLPTDPAIADPDLSVATSALNKDVERCIAICPEQFLWNYKRFNVLPDGSRRRYATIDA